MHPLSLSLSRALSLSHSVRPSSHQPHPLTLPLHSTFSPYSLTPLPHPTSSLHPRLLTPPPHSAHSFHPLIPSPRSTPSLPSQAPAAPSKLRRFNLLTSGGFALGALLSVVVMVAGFLTFGGQHRPPSTVSPLRCPATQRLSPLPSATPRHYPIYHPIYHPTPGRRVRRVHPQQLRPHRPPRSGRPLGHWRLDRLHLPSPAPRSS